MGSIDSCGGWESTELQHVNVRHRGTAVDERGVSSQCPHLAIVRLDHVQAVASIEADADGNVGIATQCQNSFDPSRSSIKPY